MPETNDRRKVTPQVVIVSILVACAVIALQGLIVSLCWNYTMPAVFGVGRLSVAQSIVMMVLVMMMSGLWTSGAVHATLQMSA